MGDNKDRINVYPSRLALQNMKQRLNASLKGASLLKKRADALAFHYRASANKALRIILETTLCMKQARITVAEAQFIGGNQSLQILESLSPLAKISLGTHFDNIAGVRLLIFDQAVNSEATDRTNMVGLGRGAEQLTRCSAAYQHALELVIQQAIVRYAMKAIDNMYDTTNRRVNGIENVVVPRLERTVHYIISELDEEEREEYFRRKKVQVKKRLERALKAERMATEDVAIPTVPRQRMGTMAATPTDAHRVDVQAKRGSVSATASETKPALMRTEKIPSHQTSVKVLPELEPIVEEKAYELEPLTLPEEKAAESEPQMEEKAHEPDPVTLPEENDPESVPLTEKEAPLPSIAQSETKLTGSPTKNPTDAQIAVSPAETERSSTDLDVKVSTVKESQPHVDLNENVLPLEDQRAFAEEALPKEQKTPSSHYVHK